MSHGEKFAIMFREGVSMDVHAGERARKGGCVDCEFAKCGATGALTSLSASFIPRPSFRLHTGKPHADQQ